MKIIFYIFLALIVATLALPIVIEFHNNEIEVNYEEPLHLPKKDSIQ